MRARRIKDLLRLRIATRRCVAGGGTLAALPVVSGAVPPSVPSGTTYAWSGRPDSSIDSAASIVSYSAEACARGETHKATATAASQKPRHRKENRSVSEQ